MAAADTVATTVMTRVVAAMVFAAVAAAMRPCSCACCSTHLVEVPICRFCNRLSGS